MTAFVALLRGINVGKAKRLPMAALRDVLAGLGYVDVQTLLNSGNAVFRAKRGTESSCATAIAAAIRAQLALNVPVVVKSAHTLAQVVAENPYAHLATDHARLLVAFTGASLALNPPHEMAGIGALVQPPEQFFVGEHAAYLHCAGGILESKAAAALLGKAGAAVTTRNWATTLKLHALTAYLSNPVGGTRAD